jgi:CRISPR/Cas system-associated endonuclease Cas1
VRCEAVNAEIGLPQTEGILHVAERKRGLGLLLDLSEAFKLVDREKLLEASLRFEICAQDFISQVGRQGVRFYYPKIDAVAKLERIGQRADELACDYQGRECSSMDAYREYAKSFKTMLDSSTFDRFIPFLYGSKADQEWFMEKVKSVIVAL